MPSSRSNSPRPDANAASAALRALSPESLVGVCERFLGFLSPSEAARFLTDALDPATTTDEQWDAIWALLRPREQEIALDGLGAWLSFCARDNDSGAPEAVAFSSLVGKLSAFFVDDSPAAAVACRRFAASIGQPSWIRWIGQTDSGDDSAPGEMGDPYFRKQCVAIFTRAVLSRAQTRGKFSEAGANAARPWCEEFLMERAQQNSGSWIGWGFLDASAELDRKGIFSPDDFKRFARRVCGDAIAQRHAWQWAERLTPQAMLAASDVVADFCWRIHKLRKETPTEREWALALGAGEKGAKKAERLLRLGFLPEPALDRMLALKALKGPARAVFERRALAQASAQSATAASAAPQTLLPGDSSPPAPRARRRL